MSALAALLVLPVAWQRTINNTPIGRLVREWYYPLCGGDGN